MASQDSVLRDSQPITTTFQQKTQRKSIKPPAVKQAVIAKAMIGTSNAQIAEELDIDRSTVRAILSPPEIQQHIDEVRSDFILGGDLWKARKVMRSKLSKGSESAATTILRGFNVLQSNTPKVEVNMNFSAQNYSQRMQARQVEQETAPVDGQTITITPESSK